MLIWLSMLVDALPCLKPLRDVVRQHIPHMYSKKMRSSTKTVKVDLCMSLL